MTGNKTGVGRGGGQRFAVEKLGAEDQVLELWKESIPATKISQILASKGIKITPLGINRYLKALKKTDTNEQEVERVKKFEMIATDYQNEITNILEEVKDMKDIAKRDEKLDSYVKLVGKLFQGLELLAKLMGDIKPKGSVDINVIINEVNKYAFEENKDEKMSILCGDNVIDVDYEIKEEDIEEQTKINA